jgi:hypothetical protein
VSELLFRHELAEIWQGDCLDEGQVDAVLKGLRDEGLLAYSGGLWWVRNK